MAQVAKEKPVTPVTKEKPVTPVAKEKPANTADQLMNAILSSQSKEIQELKEQNKLLIDQNKQKDDFLNIAVHELKSPLQPILLNAELAAKGMIDQTDALKEISDASNKVKDLMSVILDTSKIDREEFELNKSQICINNLLVEAKTMVDCSSEDTVPIVLETDGELFSFVDDVRLTQVFKNILDNAIKFTKKGLIKITSEINVRDQKIVIIFSDTGRGIPSKILPHVFEKYATDKTNNPNGTGLGLYVCKQIIDKHGGTIHAANNN
ncbi:MAG: HAMP domain-containing histidine kinase [Nitrosopumilus sp.]|nr:HAMP domain-containing histidine kinase [Nitrosopumilus sp.]